ncbi:hypothetical protein CICLE_v10033743mg, partial [Citrus x clementina]
ANKVLFVAAEKDFVDVLFNDLYMPFVTVTSLLKNVGVVSCTGNLFQSLENLSEAHLIPNPCLSATRTCAEKVVYLSKQSPSECRTMKKSVSYMVTDDLLVTTWSMISGIDLLKGKIEDIGVLEDTVQTILILGFAYGFYTSQVLELLKVSIQTNTRTALTTIFLIKDDEARSSVVTCWVYL